MQKAKLFLMGIEPRVREGKVFFVAKGYVYDHPRFFDGQLVTTSRIENLNILGENYMRTLNTMYTLLPDIPNPSLPQTL